MGVEETNNMKNKRELKDGEFEESLKFTKLRTMCHETKDWIQLTSYEVPFFFFSSADNLLVNTHSIGFYDDDDIRNWIGWVPVAVTSIHSSIPN